MKAAMDSETEGMGGNLYKKARKLRREYGKQFEDNVLVKSILGFKKNSSDRLVATEKVLNNSVLSPSVPLDSVKHLRKLFMQEGVEGRQAWRDIQSGVLQHIQNEAIKGVGRDINGKPIVSAHKLNSVITGLDNVGKLEEVFGWESAGKIRTLNDVAKVVLVTPPGSVNFSNTASMMTAYFDMMLSGSMGVPAPLTTGVALGLKHIRNARLKAKVAKALKIEGSIEGAGEATQFGREMGAVRGVRGAAPAVPSPAAPPAITPPAAGPPPSPVISAQQPVGRLASPGDLRGGRRAELFITPGEKIDTQFAIFEIEDVITSHTNNFAKTRGYPESLQPRERGRAAYEVQVMDIQQNLRPEWLGESTSLQSGSPIIGPDMFVESGNGRTIAIRRAYRSGQADDYKQYLQSNAEQFGLNSTDVAGVNKPVLVRVRRSDINRERLVELANEDIVSSFSASELAARDSQKLPDLSMFDISESGSLTSAANRPFIRSFFERVVPRNQMISMVDESGLITQQGLVRLKNAIYDKAYGSEAGNISRMAESTDSNIKNITNGMIKAAPKYGAVRELIARGELHALDLSAEFVEAAEALSRLRERGVTFAENARQGVMLAETANPLVESLTQILEIYGRSSEKIAELLSIYIDKVREAGNPRQGQLFGDMPPPSKSAVLSAAIRAMEITE
jgi:hypothetical protein